MSNDDLLRLPAVMQKTSLSRSSLYAMIRAGTFPKPIKLGMRSVAWSRSSVQAFVDSRISAGQRQAAA